MNSQHRVFTLAILLTTFTLLWENEKVIASLSTQLLSNVSEVSANDWLKANYENLKCQLLCSLWDKVPFIGVITSK